jgi:hypothetical protein
MNADSTFVIGSTHAICQDYVVAGNPQGAQAPYVILSDGCSSSLDTDIGARLLVKSAERILNTAAHTDIRHVHATAAAEALKLAALLGLIPQAVDATLLTAQVREHDLVLACSGDGVIAIQDWSGVLEAYSISYPSGYPRYPTYSQQPDRLAALGVCEERPAETISAELAAALASQQQDSGGSIQKEIKYYRGHPSRPSLELQDSFTSTEETEVFTFNARSSQYAILLSDGIHSFCTSRGSESSKRAQPILFPSFARELLSFKNTRGAFTGRRLRRFLKDCRERDWQHSDDFALGAIYLGD